MSAAGGGDKSDVVRTYHSAGEAGAGWRDRWPAPFLPLYVPRRRRYAPVTPANGNGNGNDNNSDNHHSTQGIRDEAE